MKNNLTIYFFKVVFVYFVHKLHIYLRNLFIMIW